AISRGKWAAYLVRSQVLTDFSPRSPGELVALGAFIGLCDTELQDDCDSDNGREHLALRRQRAGLPHDLLGPAQRPGARDVRSRHPGRLH
ncbi:MAG: hypothetical protein ABI131_11270, partial [Nostocoides sp.]